MAAGVYAANAAARNARRSERRRLVQASKRQAAIFFTPAQVAIRERREAEQRERRERLALYKRRGNRARGGYDPSRDGIKLLIKSRMQEIMRRRIAASRPPSIASEALPAEKKSADVPMSEPDRRRADYEWLEAERAKNREVARRRSEQFPETL